MLNFGRLLVLDRLLGLVRIMRVRVALAQVVAAMRSGVLRNCVALDIATVGLVRLTRAKGIGRLAVDGVVALEKLLLAHAQRDSQHVPDEEQDQAGPYQVPPDDEQGACQLVALECHAGRKSAKKQR